MRGFCEDLFQTVARISRGLHRQGRSALQCEARDASWRELRPAGASDKTDAMKHVLGMPSVQPVISIGIRR